MDNKEVKVGFLAFLILVSFVLSIIGLNLYGIYLAFSASILLGIVVLLLEPSGLILGLIAVSGHADIAHKLASFIGVN